MAKTPAQRQREYKQRLKEQGRYAQWKEKVKVTMRKERAKLKQTKQGRERLKAEYRRDKKAQRARQKIRDQEGTDTEKPSTSTAFKNRQHFGKCRKRVEEALPQSPRKRKEIIRNLTVEEGLHVGKPNKCVPVSGKQLTEELKTEIIKFYEDDSISYQTPGRDDFMNIHVQGETKEVRIRYLVVSLKEAHALFLQDREGISVGLTKFAELRPAHVRLQSKIPHNVCTCVVHENAKFLLKALCKKHVLTETEFRKFIAQVVCDQNSSECMQGGCEKCPGLSEADISDELVNSRCEWNQWNSRNGRFEIEVKEGSVKDCIEELTNCLPRFLNHVYVKRQQSEAFKKARENVAISEAVIQIDFSENYTCKEQNEIQAAHWNNTQISIFTAVTWYRKEGIGEIQKRSFALVSDYVSHDKYAVDICLRKVFSEMLDIVPNLEFVKVFSDGAASHFKQKYTLSHVTYISEIFGFQIEWHFFESYHGKGAVDAIGGHVKRMAWTAAKAGSRIQNAEEFVNNVRKKTKISVLEVSLPEIEEAKEFLNKDLNILHLYRPLTGFIM